MGAQPLFALAVVGMPLDKLPVEVIQRIIAGGESVCAEVGIPIAGGHSIDVLERSTDWSRSASSTRTRSSVTTGRNREMR